MDTNHKDETEKLVEKTSDTQDPHDEVDTSQHIEHSTDSHDFTGEFYQADRKSVV